MRLLLILISFTLVTQMNGQTPINYIHNEKASFTSQFLQFGMQILGFKKRSAKRIKANKFNHTVAKIPHSLQHYYDMHLSTQAGQTVWAFKPKQNASKKVILYLHGGSYNTNLTKYHWWLIEKLLIGTQATIVVPDYPLAPQATYKEALAMVEEVYASLLTQHKADDISFMGDSAGGGLALAFAQQLRDEQKPQPKHIILLSPWLDVTMTNPNLAEVDKKDKMLGIEALQLSGRLYAGNTDTKDYHISPIYGDFKGLGQLSIFIGTHDLFIMDCRKLKQQLDNAGIPLNYFEYPKMFHVWMAVTGLKESKAAVAQMSRLVLGH